MYWITPEGEYVVGDRPSLRHVACPERPSLLHTWNGLVWNLDLSAYKIAKIKGLRDSCKAANEAGFYSTALDGITQYRYSTDNSFGDSSFDGIDMMFLNAAYAKAVANKATTSWTVLYPAKSPSDTAYKAYSHTAAQMIQVGETGFDMIQANRNNLRTKSVQVALAADKTAVDAIVW